METWLHLQSRLPFAEKILLEKIKIMVALSVGVEKKWHCVLEASKAKVLFPALEVHRAKCLERLRRKLHMMASNIGRLDP